MKLTINTDVLDKYNLTFKEFLVLLVGYYELGYTKEHDDLMERGLVEKNLFSQLPPILSDNTKNLVAKILLESDDRAIQSGLNFNRVAQILMAHYPSGVKAGTTYKWQGETEEIAQKLRTLVVKYDFTFTEEEAIRAVQEYVGSFTSPYRYMHLLRNFILTTRKDSDGKIEIDSPFMSIIENNRDENSN